MTIHSNDGYVAALMDRVANAMREYEPEANATLYHGGGSRALLSVLLEASRRTMMACMQDIVDVIATQDELARMADKIPPPDKASKPIPPATVIGYYAYDVMHNTWLIFDQNKRFLWHNAAKPEGAYEPLPGSEEGNKLA